MQARSGPRARDQQDAVASLKQAREEIWNIILPAGKGDQSVFHYRNVLALTDAANKSLPPETKYLTQFLVGKASYWAGHRSRARTESIYKTDRQARYRASEHARACLYHHSEAIRLKPDFSPAYDVLADHYGLTGNSAGALLVSDKLVYLMPRCADALAKRAQYYVDLDQLEAAKEDLTTAVELSPINWRHHKELAIVLAELGEFSGASASCEKARELLRRIMSEQRRSINLDLGILHCEMGQAFKKGGNVNLAIAEFIKAEAVGFPCEDEIAECRRRVR